MIRNITRIISHPILILAFVVISLLFGYGKYLDMSHHQSVSKHNILPGNFDKLAANGLPEGWVLQKSGASNINTSLVKDDVASKDLKLVISDYKNGDSLLLSPKVNLEKQTRYLYKGYYLATVGFDLLVKYYYRDGTSQLHLVKHYPFFDDPWSTTSIAFDTSDNIMAVQTAYRVAANGNLLLRGLYLEPNNDLVIPKSISNSPNLITNGDVKSTDGWQSINNGKNQAVFAYSREGDKPYLHLEVRDFKDGEAKWVYPALPVTAGQNFNVGFEYQSSMPVELAAEYNLQNGKTQFEVIDNLLPAAEWTYNASTFEVPVGAISVTVVPVAHQNGTLNVSMCELKDLTLAGMLHYRRPLVSLSFDDGWKSAYIVGASAMEDYGYRGTFYVNPGALDSGPLFMKQADLRTLLSRGHHIASHGYDHVDMTALDINELTRQLGAARGYLEKRLNLKDLDFATPYGKDDPQVQAVIRQHYRSHRGTETGVNTRQNFDPYNLRVMFVRTDTPLAVIQNQIEEAKATNGWLILTYHRIENGDNRSEMITSPAVFKQHLELIKQSGVAVTTVHDALDELTKY
ncbi:MAG TPA: polysaccharide deacetylase family protein [Patescibacteria group bacterium]|jgi:peptidoglycan/xylan/chitin deacetylase (PgdA/CDA1 family)|nr:polysaccharide deacetylase family protein [Patescibacteria group bacterium]